MQIVKNILISNTLRQVLSQFKEESVVANLLLSEDIREDFLVGEPVNFLSISDSDENKISYLTRDRSSKITSDEFWSSSKRFHCKPGSLISKIFRDISSKEIEKFSTLFRAFSSVKEFKFEIVKGNDIIKYYDQYNYSSESGSLGNSCMKYSKCQKFLDIYKDNDIISMLVMINNENKLIGRALLWNFDDKKIMDRIYTSNDEDYQFYFKKWAINNGYSYKSKQNWTNTIQLVKNSKDFEEKLDIQLSNWNYNYYPYLDTFKWLDMKTGKLSNYKPSHFQNHNGDYIILMSPDGRYNTSECLEFDSISKDWHHQGSLQFIEEHQLYTNRDNLNYSETLDRWLLKSESSYVEEINDYIYTDMGKVDIDLLNKRILYINNKNSLKKKNPYEYLFEQQVGRSERYYNTRVEIDNQPLDYQLVDQPVATDGVAADTQPVFRFYDGAVDGDTTRSQVIIDYMNSIAEAGDIRGRHYWRYTE